MKTDNELIAVFMGYERSRGLWVEGEYAYTMKLPEVFNKWVIPSKMEFHTSWDWLMPVVKKIATDFLEKEFKSRKEFNQMYNLWKAITNGLEDIDISKTHKSVVDFIKWYNSQGK